MKIEIEYNPEEIRQLILADCANRIKCPEGYHWDARQLYSDITARTVKDEPVSNPDDLPAEALDLEPSEPIPADPALPPEVPPSMEL